jgi:hypothetical protein
MSYPHTNASQVSAASTQGYHSADASILGQERRAPKDAGQGRAWGTKTQGASRSRNSGRNSFQGNAGLVSDKIRWREEKRRQRWTQI